MVAIKNEYALYETGTLACCISSTIDHTLGAVTPTVCVISDLTAM